MNGIQSSPSALDFDSTASRFVYLQLRFLRAFKDNF